MARATLDNASLINADLTNANLSTAKLADADLTEANLAGANLHNSNIMNAKLTRANLTDADLGSATLTNAMLDGAVVMGAIFTNTTKSRGFNQAQLVSTASYQAKDLTGIQLGNNDLTGWDLSGQNLTMAQLYSSKLTDVNLSGANLKNTNLDRVSEFFAIVFSANTVYNQWTVFPADVTDPASYGLTFMPTQPGDFDANDAFDAADVDLLAAKIRGETIRAYWLPASMFDLNSDSIIDGADHDVWVTDVKQTYFGDANLDGEFGSSDLVQVFSAGQYEDAVEGNSGWSTGDWNGDGEFTTSDLVAAFQDGGYEAGPRLGVVAVPEPTELFLLGIGLSVCWVRRWDRHAT